MDSKALGVDAVDDVAPVMVGPLMTAAPPALDEPDTTPPTVTEQLPPPGTQILTTSMNIDVTFSEAVVDAARDAEKWALYLPRR